MLTAVLYGCSSKEQTIGLKENLQHDDFFYSVQDAETVEKIGEREAKGTFYIVSFRVRNDAKRVEHEWKNNVAYVTDENGNVYENDNELQKLLNSIQPFGYRDSYISKAGTTESTIFVFDIPDNVKETYLKYRGEYLMGDIFDGNRFKNTRVKLF
jgi:hypothetical protein